MQQQTTPVVALAVKLSNREFKELLAYLDFYHGNTRVTTFIDWILH